MITFDIASVPFSRAGSYLAISQLPANSARAAGVYLRTMHGDAPNREICRLELLIDNIANDVSITASPTVLRLSTAQSAVEVCFSDRDTLHIRGKNCGIRLTFATGEYDQAVARNGGWQINSFSNRVTLALFSLRGKAVVDAPPAIARSEHIVIDINAEGRGQFECLLGECRDEWPQDLIRSAKSFAAHRRAVEVEFAEWLQQAPSVARRFHVTRELASYVQWSAIVAPSGLLSRPAMLMSKNWLTAVWSWDHCFNAMALSYRNVELAWHQFMLPFDFQRASGALPDCINDTQTIWNFCKPPIHGWTLQWLLKRKAIGIQHLQQIYAPLSRWTEWWLHERDDNRNGLAQYNHGNDSGWDNSTLFDGGMPAETPDLSAFLIVQMQMLATIAQRLKKPRAAKQWQQRSDALLQTLMLRLWRDDGFVGLRDDEFITSDTLLLLLPLILGEQLPASIRKVLVKKLQHRFLTEHGLASEAPHSDGYIADGYWRGPIWAPSTLLLVDALTNIGEDALATTIAARFCALVEHGGMAENFNALTGAPLRDRAHTWSASVFVILAHEYLR